MTFGPLRVDKLREAGWGGDPVLRHDAVSGWRTDRQHPAISAITIRQAITPRHLSIILVEALDSYLEALKATAAAISYDLNTQSYEGSPLPVPLA